MLQQKLTSAAEIEDWLSNCIGEILEIEKDDVDTRITFNHLGVDSITAVEITGKMEELLGFKIDPVVLFKYPTIEKVSKFLAKKAAKK